MTTSAPSRQPSRDSVPLPRLSDEAATAHLNAMNQRGPHPWELSYSYGRALQAPALKAWAGKKENFAAGQKAFHHRSRCNSAARYGRWSEALEGEAR